MAQVVAPPRGLGESNSKIGADTPNLQRLAMVRCLCSTHTAKLLSSTARLSPPNCSTYTVCCDCQDGQVDSFVGNGASDTACCAYRLPRLRSNYTHLKQQVLLKLETPASQLPRPCTSYASRASCHGNWLKRYGSCQPVSGWCVFAIWSPAPSVCCCMPRLQGHCISSNTTNMQF